MNFAAFASWLHNYQIQCMFKTKLTTMAINVDQMHIDLYLALHDTQKTIEFKNLHLRIFVHQAPYHNWFASRLHLRN